MTCSSGRHNIHASSAGPKMPYMQALPGPRCHACNLYRPAQKEPTSAKKTNGKKKVQLGAQHFRLWSGAAIACSAARRNVHESYARTKVPYMQPRQGCRNEPVKAKSYQENCSARCASLPPMVRCSHSLQCWQAQCLCKLCRDQSTIHAAPTGLPKRSLSVPCKATGPETVQLGARHFYCTNRHGQQGRSRFACACGNQSLDNLASARRGALDAGQH